MLAELFGFDPDPSADKPAESRAETPATPVAAADQAFGCSSSLQRTATK